MADQTPPEPKPDPLDRFRAPPPIIIPPDATPEEEEKLRFPVVPPPSGENEPEPEE